MRFMAKEGVEENHSNLKPRISMGCGCGCLICFFFQVTNQSLSFHLSINCSKLDLKPIASGIELNAG